MRVPLFLFLLLTCLLAACDTKPESVIPYSALPAEGDAVRGEQIFTAGSDPLCTSCHFQNSLASPSLDGYGERAGTRVEDQSAREYTFYSIVEPWRFLNEGYGNAMPNSYDNDLTPQDIADLIAYLLSR